MTYTRSSPVTDPDIEAACEDITKGLKTHRGCSPGSDILAERLAAEIERYQRRPYSTAIDRFSFSLNEKEAPLLLALLRGVAQRPLNTDAEPSRCKNTVARGESMETDALTGDAPVASVSTLSAQPEREPDSWQWRACIGGQWGAWLDLDWPVERFRERNKFNFDNGTYELRPLYAGPALSSTQREGGK